MKKVMVTKGLRGRSNPEAYHKKCITAVEKYYAGIGQPIELTSWRGVSNSFDGSTASKRLVGLAGTIAHEVAVADEIVFMDDWERYDGCVVEHLIAIRYGIPCLYLRSDAA